MSPSSRPRLNLLRSINQRSWRPADVGRMAHMLAGWQAAPGVQMSEQLELPAEPAVVTVPGMPRPKRPH